MSWDSSSTPSVAYGPTSTDALTARFIANIAITATCALYTVTCRKYPTNETIYKIATATLGLWTVVTYPYIVDGCGYPCMDDSWPSDNFYGEMAFSVLRVSRGFLACTALFHLCLWRRDIVLSEQPNPSVRQDLELEKKAASKVLAVGGTALLLLSKVYRMFTDTTHPLALSLPVKLGLGGLFWILYHRFSPQISNQMRNTFS